ncbi:branched-chain amino acid ABC transporter permease/ATP-binding protein [Dactylosporangium sp. NBC_01737]|uniref:branched-chain amino acid ABC transporter permease/ATP-binding protein n=1 Tax=Dactylosporangium sp. NBC_01737 TaxID=2975959 RepID=UPI002E14CA4D|nr:branched-chain amino acid ABC transporter permease/ATP-binding protein [Dactylosporangium sp. NBC_01737]
MEVVQFLLLGLGIGAIYSLLGQGLVLIYRGSGIVNFAQGSFVMVGGYAYYEFRVSAAWPAIPSVVAATAVGALLGVAVQFLILRPMRTSSPIERVIATLGVLLTLQAAAVLRYGVSAISVPSFLPTDAVEPLPGAVLGVDRLIILLIGAVLTAALYAVFRWTSFGRVASAMSENQRAAASLGHSPDRIATANWALATGIAALAGALLGPITFLQPTQLTLLVVPALAAALLARFVSFPIAFAGALGIGVVQSLTTRYVTVTGWGDSVPFIVIVAYLILRGSSLPLRSHVLERLPSVGDGRIRVVPAVLVVGVFAFLIAFVVSPVWAQALTVTMAFAILTLSVTVVTGYAGQLSLAQYVLAGSGAFAAATFVARASWSFLPSLLGAMAAAALVGVLVALPALRTRGINLAIATLGMGIVLFSLVLSDFQFAGGDTGIRVGSPSILGWDFGAIVHPYRYGLVALAALTLSAVAVANLRRGRAGRRLLAVRSNERAAAALGVNVFAGKLYAFALASALAALAGVLLAFQGATVLPAQFDVLTSITVIGVSVVGGIGSIGGALLAATLLPGGVGTQLLHGVDNLERYLPLASGLFLLYVLRSGRNGLYEMNAHLVRSIGRLVRWPSRPTATTSARRDERGALDMPAHVQRPRRSLHVSGLRVQFGGVVAVDDVSLDLVPGEVHGLIGPNGAGKTTVIDALTGFVRPSRGTIRLDDVSVAAWSARRRARAGMARSFQSLELFADLSVRENLAVACDNEGALRYLSDLVAPGRIQLTPPAIAAIREFQLEDDLDRKPGELAFGRRRLVAIARAVAADPRVLLLDEPAAGLSDEEARELGTLIRTLASDWGMSILLVEHNVDLVLSTCDRVTVLEAGAVLARGTPQDIARDPRVVSAYLGREADESDDGARV